MKKQGISILVIITIAFAAFTFGFFLGKNHSPEPVILSIPSSMQSLPPETTVPETEETLSEPAIVFPIDINHADRDEFMALPGIGEVLAGRILAYREENGDFSAVEELLNVEGIGKKRFEEILDLITIGG